MGVFDYVNAVNNGQQIDVDGDYVQFIINKQFSYFPDTIFVANELNQRTMSNEEHFNFLINIIRPGKRFSKWSKVDQNDDIKMVAEYFGYSLHKAKEIFDLLSDVNIEEIRKTLEQGGVK